MDFGSFLNFDKMMTPIIIKIVLWVGVAISVLMGLFTILSGLTSHFGGGLQVVTGLITMVIGPLVTRIYCELLIIIFKMHESLTEIKEALNKQPQQTELETE